MTSIISGLLYRAGGTDQWEWCPINQKMWRSFIGIPIGILWAFMFYSFIPLLCILTYWFQPPYGENSYLNFLGEWGKFAVCGAIFGLSSTPAWIGMGWWWIGVLQGVIGAGAFVYIKYLDDKDVIKNPWVEIYRGLFGTILLGIAEVIWLIFRLIG